MIIIIPQIINFKIGKFNTSLQTKEIWGSQGVIYALIRNLNMIKLLHEFYITISKTNIYAVKNSVSTNFHGTIENYLPITLR